jgi:hypothetical protein
VLTAEWLHIVVRTRQTKGKALSSCRGYFCTGCRTETGKAITYRAVKHICACVKLTSCKAELNTQQKNFEICSLLRYYAASSGNPIPTFRDNVSVPSSRVKKSRSLFFYFFSLDFLTFEDVTDTFSRNVGKGLPHDAA